MEAVEATRCGCSCRSMLACLAAGLACWAAGLAVPPAAAANSPWWHLASGARPTNLPSEAGARGELVVRAANLGDAPIDGAETPVKIVDRLPPGLKAVFVSGNAGEWSSPVGPVECSLEPLTCEFSGSLVPYDRIEVVIGVEVEAAAATGEINEVRISGGGAPDTSIARPVEIGGEPAPFGIEDYELTPEEVGGVRDTRAGSHPFQLTTTVTLNQTAGGSLPEWPKDLRAKLPPGLIGNANAIPRCGLTEFYSAGCSSSSVVGVVILGARINESASTNPATLTLPVFNLEPSPGEPARFGALVLGPPAIPVLIDVSIRGSSGDYGATLSIEDISQPAELLSATVTLWGVPGDPHHDGARGSACLARARGGENPCPPLEEPSPPPLLTLPTSCAGPLQTSAEIDSWSQPGSFLIFSGEPMQALKACSKVPFSPTLAVEPTAASAASPTGLNFDLSVNDEGLVNATGIAQSQLGGLGIDLPEGMSINPSIVAGLRACTLAQYESETPGSAPGSACPNESKIGDVEIESPLLSEGLSGSIYVAKQDENRLQGLFVLYIVARSPGASGVLVKLPAELQADEASGRLRLSIENLPQLPFSHIALRLPQDQRTALVNPPACGSYPVQATLTPVSAPASPRPEDSSFQIERGVGGGPCPAAGAQPFRPRLAAGTLSNAAGSYSPLVLRLNREDGEARLASFSAELPPGLSGRLAGIPLCPEAAIEAVRAASGATEQASPSCPAASQVGTANVGIGAGSSPFYAPGRVYLAGPYEGAPFSLAIVVPAIAGPFDLGTVVSRAGVFVDPETARLTVRSDPLPSILAGVPLDIRELRIKLDRPGFIRNPTSCEPMRVKGTAAGLGVGGQSGGGAAPSTAALSAPFQAADCAALGFRPRLLLRFTGGLGQNNHPGLRVVLRPHRGEAGLAGAAFTLPATELLDPSHIHAVCGWPELARGRCPAGSIVGRARAWSPFLRGALRGPIYLRASSHRLPGLTADLHGAVHLLLNARTGSSHGALQVSFTGLPDVPLSRAVIDLAGGRRGLFVNSEPLCPGSRRAKVRLVAQSGRVRRLSAPLLTGSCGRRRR